MTLYFANSADKRISVTNLSEITIPSSNIVTATLPSAGEYVIKRTNGESYLYYIALSPVATAIRDVIVPVSAQVPVSVNLAGQRVGMNYRGLVIVGGKKIMR